MSRAVMTPDQWATRAGLNLARVAEEQPGLSMHVDTAPDTAPELQVETIGPVDVPGFIAAFEHAPTVRGEFVDGAWYSVFGDLTTAAGDELLFQISAPAHFAPAGTPVPPVWHSPIESAAGKI